MELNKFFSWNQPNISKVVFFIFSLIIFQACKEEPLQVGQNILPEDEILGVGVDTLQVELHTLTMEPVFTRDLGISPLGGMNDPLFGSVTCDFVTDFTFAGSFDFNEETDSLVNLELIVKFSSTYANYSGINFNVYKLNVPIPGDAYSNFEPDPGMYDTEKLNLGNPEAVHETETDTLGNEISDEITEYRVFLSNEFGKSLLNSEIIKDSAYYYDSIFRSYFYGFYFEAVHQSGKALGLINLSHTDSRLILRTARFNDTLKENDIDTIENEFVLAYPDLGGTSINMYHSNFSSTISAVLNDTVRDQEYSYIQSLVGPKTLISIPGLFAKRREYNYKASVSKAELVLPIDTITFDNDYYKAPVYLGIRDVEKDTNIIDDGLISGYFGGVLDTINMEYRFNVGNYIHYFLRDSLTFTDERLYLFAANYYELSSYPAAVTYFSLTTPGRVVLNSVNATRKPILRIIYSKLP